MPHGVPLSLWYKIMLLKMAENRVWRRYRGGKLLDALHGREGTDGL